MVGTLFINGKDAWTTYGVFLEGGSRNKLIMGVPLKDFITNKSRLDHGKRVSYLNPRKDERDVELVFVFKKPGDFVTNYNLFMEELYKGEVKLKYVGSGINNTFRFTYLSCRNLNTVQYLGKLSVRFNEPNPNNRGND